MCFGLPWLEAFLVGLVIVILICAILSAVAKFIVPKLGWAAETAALVIQIIWWVIAAVIIIWLIHLAFDAIYCIGSLPRLR